MLKKKVSDEKDEARWTITTHLSQTKMWPVTVIPYYRTLNVWFIVLLSSKKPKCSLKTHHGVSAERERNN